MARPQTLLSLSTIRKLYHIPHGRLRPLHLGPPSCCSSSPNLQHSGLPRPQLTRATNLVLLVNNIILTIIILITLIQSSQCLQGSQIIQHQQNNPTATQTQPCIPVQNSTRNLHHQHHHHQQQQQQQQQQSHNSTQPQELICPPVILNKENELIVGAGSNVTLACYARGAGPLTFVWFQDEKNLVGRNNTDSNSPTNNPSDPPPSTKLLEERRYEIAEEIGPNNVSTSTLYLINLKITDTSVFLCWVENAAGFAIGNFSLIVNDSPPAHLGGCGADGSSSLSSSSFSCGLMRLDTRTTQVAIVSAGFILLLAAAIICLLMLRQVLASRRQSTKSTSQSDLKSQQANDQLTKSSPAHMFASSDEDGATEEDDDDRNSSVGSSASCRKTGKDLDDFIERMRSGIINMDYHAMSPVNQFNNPLKQQQQHQHQQQQPPQHRPPQQQYYYQPPLELQLQQQQQLLHHIPPQQYYYQPSHELQLQQQQQQPQNFQPMALMNHHYSSSSGFLYQIQPSRPEDLV